MRKVPSVPKADVERQLMAVLRSLAAEPSEQEQAYAPFCPVHEMLSEFEHWSMVWIGNFGAAGTVDQRSTVAVIDAELSALSDEELTCSDPEPLGSAGWARVRAASQAALAAFGWSRLPLPRQMKMDGGGYIEENE
jgi:hypothetical protein